MSTAGRVLDKKSQRERLISLELLRLETSTLASTFVLAFVPTFPSTSVSTSVEKYLCVWELFLVGMSSEIRRARV